MRVFVSRWAFRGSIISISGAVFAAYFPITLLLFAGLHIFYYLKIHHHPLLKPTCWLLVRLLISVTPERGEWAGNSSGDLGCLLYLSFIFNSLQSMLMTLDICLISVHSVTLSLAHSSHTLEPSPKLHPMLRVTICSLFLESQFQIFCHIAKSDVRPYASYFLWGKYLHLPMLQFPNSAHRDFYWFCETVYEKCY